MSDFEHVAQVDVVETVDSLFRAHYARLTRSLTVACGDAELAADAVQEAFVKAHQHWRRIRRYDDPVGWIRRVAINRLRDDHRRQGRKTRAVQRLASQPEQPSVQQHDAAGLGDLLAQLPRQQRLAMALFYVDELSISEVAAALELSEGAVKSYLHQGRAKLRGVVASEQEVPSE